MNAVPAGAFGRLLGKSLSTIDVLNLSVLACVFILYLAALARTPYRVRLLILYALLTLFILLMSRVRALVRSERLRNALLFLYPVVFLFSLFETFYMLLPFFNSTRLDAWMAVADHALLGVHPTIWMEPWIHPPLTDFLSLLYLFYFPMPLIILGWMFGKGRLMGIEKSLFMFLVCYYGAYLMYFFIPVEGPRFYLNGLQTVALGGVLAEGLRRAIDALEPNKLDAFPSLHAAITTMTLIVTFRQNRGMFLVFLPCAAGIMVSLVYLRYHYVVDVIAGIVWAAASCWIAGRAYPVLRPTCASHFGGVEP